jgi:hypothetical protein
MPSDVVSAMKALHKELECAICLELLNEPCSLQCCHVFCSTCVDALQVLKCPLCQQEFSRRTKTPDYYLSNLIRMFGVLEAASISSLKVSKSFFEKCFNHNAYTSSELHLNLPSSAAVFKSKVCSIPDVQNLAAEANLPPGDLLEDLPVSPNTASSGPGEEISGDEKAVDDALVSLWNNTKSLSNRSDSCEICRHDDSFEENLIVYCGTCSKNMFRVIF